MGETEIPTGHNGTGAGSVRGWVSREDPWEAQGREHLSNVNDDMAIMEHYINAASYLKDLPDLTCRLQGIQLQLGCAQDPVGLEQAPMYVREQDGWPRVASPPSEPMQCPTPQLTPYGPLRT